MILIEPAMAYPDSVHTQAYKQAFNTYLRKGAPGRNHELLTREDCGAEGLVDRGLEALAFEGEA